jgi:hypothetical protein
MTTETTWNYGTRERLYADLAAGGVVIDTTAVHFGFVQDGSGTAADVATWHAATVEDDATAAPSAWVLIGPTGDAVAPVTLAKDTWRVFVRVTTADERPIPYPPLTLRLV